MESLWTQALADLTVIEVAVIVVASMFAGFMRGFLGFGGALVIILVLNVVLGPRVAIPIACLSGLPATVQLLPTAIRLSERAFVLPFGIASFVAAPLGTWVLVSIDPALMKVFIAALVLVLVGILQRGWRSSANAPAVRLFGLGLFTGLVQGSAGVGGPPAVAIALARAGSPELQRANVIGGVTALALCALIPLYLAGLFTERVIVLSLTLVPLYSGSTWLGARYFSGQGKQHYRSAALLALALAACITLIIALDSYFSS